MLGFCIDTRLKKLEDYYKKELKEKGIIYDENSPLFMSYHTNQHGAEKGTKMVNFNDPLVNASIVILAITSISIIRLMTSVTF